jgi:isopentenyl-diphosphate delta-isomerase
VEIAKSIALGAQVGGIAKPFLEKAVQGRDALIEYVDNIVKEIKVAMFLVGARNLDELQQVPVLITGKTAEWMNLRGFDPRIYAKRG